MGSRVGEGTVAGNLAQAALAFGAYLPAASESERERGRLALDADTGALALVATAHHLFTTQPPPSSDPDNDLRRVVAALISVPRA
ncbi:hypothetical protein ACTMTI_44400 [Nonomuraea sp. H19]|uniref:hypothetical protein n=1 Tax=Nonomuraea sp. H19 TaxID=3452206 RepID=UPI003F8CC2E2